MKWVLLVALTLIVSATGAWADRYSDCNSGNPDRRIRGCTRIIERGTRESKRNRIAAYFNRGMAYLDKSEFDRAIADFSQVLILDPNDAYAYASRGWSYYFKDEYDRAIADFTKAIALKPNDANLFGSRAMAYFAKGEYDRAIADYTEAIALNPTDPSSYNSRGQVYHAKGDYDRAIADYTKAIEKEPKFVAGYHNRAMAYLEKGDYDRAIADFTQAIALDPKLAIAYYYRGSTYGLKGDYDRAIADFTKVLALDPESDSAYFSRGVAYLNKDEYDLAIADFSKSIELYPKFTYAFALRGLAYEKKGERKKAIADYKKALEIDPENKIAQEGLDRLSGRIAKRSRKRSRKKSTAAMVPPRMWLEQRLSGERHLGRAGIAETRARGTIAPRPVALEALLNRRANRVTDSRGARPAAGAEPKDAQMEGAPARAALTEPGSVGFDGQWQMVDGGGALEIKGKEWRHPEMGIADLLRGRGAADYEVQYRHHRGVLCAYRIKKTSDGQTLILEPTNLTQPVDFCPSGTLLKVGP